MYKKLVITLLSSVALCATAHANKISLTWDISCNTNVNQYVLYYGTNTLTSPKTNVYPASLDNCGINRPAETNVYKGDYTSTIITDGRTNNLVVLTNLIKGTKYYFTVSCRILPGIESEKCNEIEYTVPLYSTNDLPSKTVGFRILSIQ